MATMVTTKRYGSRFNMLIFFQTFFAISNQFIHQNFGILSAYDTKFSSKLSNDLTEKLYVNWNFSQLQQFSHCYCHVEHIYDFSCIYLYTSAPRDNRKW